MNEQTLSTDVEVGSGTRNVTTEKFDDRPRPAGTSGSSSSLVVTRPVYKLIVEDVRPVNVPAAGPACR